MLGVQQHSKKLHNIHSPWPFSFWAMYILGLFPIAKVQVKFLLVAIDYFTKLIETEPLAKMTAQKEQKFTWRSLICRQGLIFSIVTNNGTHFMKKGNKQFLLQLDIKHLVSFMEHAQTNEQAKATNKVILTEMKKKVGETKCLWTEERSPKK